MTDNEIIKVLECCGKEYSCEKCALNTWLDEKRDCIGAILVNALDLINRLQDEKQALINGQETLQKHLTDKQGQIEKFEKIEHFATKTIDTQHAEIERLKHRKTELQIRNQELQHEKSEAINEFAHLIIDRSRNGVIYTSDIPDLVKEMTAQATFEKVEHNSLCETETYKGCE